MLVFNKIIKLSRDIASLLLKNQDPSDLKDLQTFNEADRDYILKNLSDKSILKEHANLSNQIDKDQNWKIVKSKIDVKPTKKRYWAYAAVLVVALVSGYFLEQNLFVEKTVVQDPPIVLDDTTIEEGTDKAILTLNDGTQVALEQGATYQNGNVKSNGQQIIYNDQDKTSITYNYLTIPRGGQFFIKLSDGTQVWLNSESQLKYPTSFKDGEMREVELVYGEAYFDVSPSAKHKGAKFKVWHGKQEIEVFGTEFNIKAYRDETNIYTTLVEGKVSVSFETIKRNLEPNQQLNLNIDSKSLSVATIDVYNEISWKDGVFSFEAKPLKDIMKVLSRWYDMEVVFENESVALEEFNGILDKNQDLRKILLSIESFGVIKNFEINDKKVVIK